jgi:sulfatase maturation enzyme AslB (radical SAM superfamily)
MTRCNPYGYATDAGPRHLMGGFYDSRYAGSQTVNADGVHGVAICERSAQYRMRMICPNGHQGPVMDLCPGHVREITARMSDCCTRCVWPAAARGVNESMDYVMARMAEARDRRDRQALVRLASQLDDLRHQMDELMARGIIAKVPLQLVEVSLWAA